MASRIAGTENPNIISNCVQSRRKYEIQIKKNPFSQNSNWICICQLCSMSCRPLSARAKSKAKLDHSNGEKKWKQTTNDFFSILEQHVTYDCTLIVCVCHMLNLMRFPILCRKVCATSLAKKKQKWEDLCLCKNVNVNSIHSCAALLPPLPIYCVCRWEMRFKVRMTWTDRWALREGTTNKQKMKKKWSTAKKRSQKKTQIVNFIQLSRTHSLLQGAISDILYSDDNNASWAFAFLSSELMLGYVARAQRTVWLAGGYIHLHRIAYTFRSRQKLVRLIAAKQTTADSTTRKKRNKILGSEFPSLTVSGYFAHQNSFVAVAAAVVFTLCRYDFRVSRLVRRQSAQL